MCIVSIFFFFLTGLPHKKTCNMCNNTDEYNYLCGASRFRQPLLLGNYNIGLSNEEEYL